MTTVQQINELIENIQYEQSANCPPAAKREFAIAITALEDAAMRFNRGLAIKHGQFQQSDVEGKMKAELEISAEPKLPETDIHPDQLTFADADEDLSSAA